MPTKIFVGNVAVNTARESMLQLFQRYGCVTECDVLGNYAFVVSICILIHNLFFPPSTFSFSSSPLLCFWVRIIHKKLDQICWITFMFPGLAELVPGPVLMNYNETFHFFTTGGGKKLVIQSYSIEWLTMPGIVHLGADQIQCAE